jgi:hypothetical protein
MCVGRATSKTASNQTHARKQSKGMARLGAVANRTKKWWCCWDAQVIVECQKTATVLFWRTYEGCPLTDETDDSRKKERFQRREPEAGVAARFRSMNQTPERRPGFQIQERRNRCGGSPGGGGWGRRARRRGSRGERWADDCRCQRKGDDGEVRGVVPEQLLLLASSVEDKGTTAAPSARSTRRTAVPSDGKLEDFPVGFSAETETFSLCSLLRGRGREGAAAQSKEGRQQWCGEVKLGLLKRRGKFCGTGEKERSRWGTAQHTYSQALLVRLQVGGWDSLGVCFSWEL